jgi:DNA-binding XRE family transcriptional regulator
MKRGEKFRLLRGNLTQEELAKHSGVDKAILSKIESGKMTGTLECHKKLAKVFGMKLSELYAYLEEEKSEPAEYHSSESKTDFYDDFFEILTTKPLAKKMFPTIITLQPKEEKFLLETLKKVERFIMVLEGEIEIGIENKIYNLRKKPKSKTGDSLYSLSSSKHKIKNTGSSVAYILCISAPPLL